MHAHTEKDTQTDGTRHGRYKTQRVQDRDGIRHKRYKTQTVEDTDGTRHARYTTQTVQDTDDARRCGTQMVQDTHGTRNRRYKTQPDRVFWSTTGSRLATPVRLPESLRQVLDSLRSCHSFSMVSTFSPLSELTEGSARVAQFKLSSYNPWEDTYKYVWGKEERTSTVFKCNLVDVADPTKYCHAEFKKTAKNHAAYAAALKKFTEGAVFIFKGIAFVKEAKSQYLSASKREVVNLACTTAEAVHGLTMTSAVQPCPMGTVSEKLQLQQDQRFDLTALIKDVSPKRDAGRDAQTGQDKECFDITLIDGSTNESKDKIMQMPLTIFMVKDSDVHQRFLQCSDKSEPVTLLQMQGSKNKENEYTFQSAFKGWHMVPASAAQPGSDKAQQLISNATALKADVNTESFATTSYETRVHRDYSAVPGRETTVKLFLSLPRISSGIPDLDKEESVWQINWTRVHEPASQSPILNKRGTKLWFPVTFLDGTMKHSLWMQEEAALQLSGCKSKADFLNKHADGSLWFPLVCSLKIVRKRNAATDDGTTEASETNTETSQASAEQPDYDALIVEAAGQDLTQTPTSKSLVLIDMLAARLDAVDVFLPAALHMLQKSELYALGVRFAAQKLPDALCADPTRPLYAPTPAENILRPCCQAFCMVKATGKGDTIDLGNGGFKLVNKTVTDALFDNSAQQDTTCYTVTAYCTKDNVQDFQLSPPRGAKCQYALIVVTDMIPGSSADAPPNLIVDSIQQLSRDELQPLQKSMQKLLYYYAATSEITTRKRKQEWSETFSPAQAQKCRSISRHPTGESMPDYDSTPRKFARSD